MSGEKKAVLIPVELYKKVEERVRASDFQSVEEYITFVLEEVLREEPEEEEEEAPAFSEAEEEEVKRRLRALGYLE